MRAVVLIAAVTSAAYASSFAGVFVFDDGPAIADNPHIHHLWPLSTAMAAPPDSTVSGRPIVSLTLALNYALTPDLWGYHAVNLAIHVLAALTPFGIVRRTLATGVRHVSDTSLTPLALCIALLWAVHPLQTSAVTYVVQRAESLMGLFHLLTLYCAIRAIDGPWWIVAALVACALGMATKESMVTAPLIVVAWDWFFAPQQMRRRPPLQRHIELEDLTELKLYVGNLFGGEALKGGGDLSYTPDGSAGNRYSPRLSVVVVLTPTTDGLRASTVTPGSTAPDASFTIP
ncbi:MAG: hypothetical protein AUH72_03445 [Acidobacteria bacterium 13_1_40CM_4_65_8]|nr:MAG: hypothetical protein AUH72_03445 [Acidobacteria bacterium 13_1_40CM_4_65_8]